MTEIEVPTEHLHETLEHHAHEAGGHHDAPSWIPVVALSAAVLAVLAAISALFAGHHANEAMLEQIQASDNYAYFQAKSIKAAVLKDQIELLTALGKSVSDAGPAKLETYKHEQDEIREKADEEVRASHEHLARHNILARAVTLFQIAIALSAIAVLTKRKKAWYLSIGLGAAGAFFLVQALL